MLRYGQPATARRYINLCTCIHIHRETTFWHIVGAQLRLAAPATAAHAHLIKRHLALESAHPLPLIDPRTCIFVACSYLAWSLPTMKVIDLPVVDVPV